MIFRVTSHSIDTNVSIRSTPTCWFDQRVGVLFIDMSMTTTFRQQRPHTLNWDFEKSIATIAIYKLSIHKIHWKQLNTRLLVENRTCKLIICTKLQLSTLCWKYYENTHFPAISNFVLAWAAAAAQRPSDWSCRRPERQAHQRGPARLFLYYYSFVFRERAVTRINLQLKLDSDRSWLHYQLELVVVNLYQLVA